MSHESAMDLRIEEENGNEAAGKSSIQTGNLGNIINITQNIASTPLQTHRGVCTQFRSEENKRVYM